MNFELANFSCSSVPTAHLQLAKQQHEKITLRNQIFTENKFFEIIKLDLQNSNWLTSAALRFQLLISNSPNSSIKKQQ